MNIGGVIETLSWKDKADAVLLSWQPGQEAGDAVAEVLSGAVNPSGKLAQTFPKDYKDVPSSNSFPGIPADFPLDSNYNEGIFVGYRYYDTFKIPVAYPFGYGMSYSQFDFSNLKVQNDESSKTLQVSFTVTNSGNTEGKEVAQIYVSAPHQKMKKPIQELKAFAKTELLQSGKSQTFSVTIPYYDLSSFDSVTSSWKLETGNYELRVGNSSQNILIKQVFHLSNATMVLKTENLLKPDRVVNELEN